jgi:hypothetical protein
LPSRSACCSGSIPPIGRPVSTRSRRCGITDLSARSDRLPACRMCGRMTTGKLPVATRVGYADLF